MSNQLGTGQEEDRQQKHQSHAQLGKCCLLPIGSIAGSIAHSLTEQPIVISVGLNLNLWRCQSFTMYRNEWCITKTKHYTMHELSFKGNQYHSMSGSYILSYPMSVTAKWTHEVHVILAPKNLNGSGYMLPNAWLKWLVHCIVQTILLIWCTSFTNTPVHNDLDTHITNGGAGFLSSSICRLLKMS